MYDNVNESLKEWLGGRVGLLGLGEWDCAMCFLGLLSIVEPFGSLKLLLLRLAGDIEINPGPLSGKSSSKLSVCHANVRSIRSLEKFEHIRIELTEKYDIITLSETWLTSENSSEDYSIPNYDGPLRRDRADGYGGLAVWIKSNLYSKHRKDLEDNQFENLWLEIRNNNERFLLCCLYKPPVLNKDFWQFLNQNYSQAFSISNLPILLTGDLNSDPNTIDGKYLKEFCSHNNLNLLITSPTRITPLSATILDQFISNSRNLILSTSVGPPLPSCDHAVISAVCNLNPPQRPAYKRTIWFFDKTDFVDYRLTVKAYNWNRLWLINDIDGMAEEFTESLLSIAGSTIPNTLATIRPNDKPWYTSELRSIRRKTKRLYKQFKSCKSVSNSNAYRSAIRNYQKRVKEEKSKFDVSKYKQLADEALRNGKKWWRLAKSALGQENNNTIPAMLSGDETIVDNQKKAELFNEFFCGITNLDTKGKVVPDIGERILDIGNLEKLEITVIEVQDQLSILLTSKAYGPDNISPRFLKEARAELAPVLAALFNLCLKASRFPKIWKRATVIPLHKKDSKNLTNNYRPVSLISIVARVFERVVFKHIYNHLHDNFLLSPNQSGFLPGRSSVTQLLEICDIMCKALDKGTEIRVIFLDISKTFDKVWHEGIVRKLRAFGISGGLLDWFEDYLKDRKQRVAVNGSLSSWGDVLAGVPQGSVLGPLLFLIYINDMTSVIEFSQIRLFADDTCLFLEIDNREDNANKINSDLAKVNEWSRDWLLTFAASKTKSLLVSNKLDRDHVPPAMLNDTLIEDVESFDYLGLRLSYNLRWHHHIEKVVAKAQKALTPLIKLKNKLDRRTLEDLYMSFVRPVLEYASPVWAGTYDSDFDSMERVIVRAMRIATGGTWNCSVTELYTETGWLSIKKRAENASLLQLSKIRFGMAPDYLLRLKERKKYCCLTAHQLQKGYSVPNMVNPLKQ